MGNPVRESSGTTSFILKKVEGKKGSSTHVNNRSSTSGTFVRNRIQPERATLAHLRLPVIFGVSVFIFAMTFVGIVLLFAHSQRTEATSSVSERVVLVEKESRVEMVPVIVPVRDIKKGERLDPALFQVVTRPKMAVPLTVLGSPDAVRGGYARAMLIHNQPISQEMIEGAKILNPVIASIEPGYRAVTISVTATSSVEGWATAGAYVDVHWIAPVRGEPAASLLVENAKILSAERAVESQKQGGQPVPTTITLLVSERQAKRIALASNGGGSLVMHLRGTEDINKAALASTLTLKDLLASERMAAHDEGRSVVRYQGADGTWKELPAHRLPTSSTS